MRDLLEWTTKELSIGAINPLLIIANFIFEYLAIHPFQDGNGRTSRILTNMMLLQSGYRFVPFVSHEALVESRKVDYYIALNKTQQTRKTEKENLSPRVLFFLEIIKEQAAGAMALSSGENIEPLLSKIQLKVWEAVNTSEETTRKKISEITGISYHTVGQAIKKLIQMKKVERLGDGRAVRYRAKK